MVSQSWCGLIVVFRSPHAQVEQFESRREAKDAFDKESGSLKEMAQVAEKYKTMAHIDSELAMQRSRWAANVDPKAAAPVDEDSDNDEGLISKQPIKRPRDNNWQPQGQQVPMPRRSPPPPPPPSFVQPTATTLMTGLSHSSGPFPQNGIENPDEQEEREVQFEDEDEIEVRTTKAPAAGPKAKAKGKVAQAVDASAATVEVSRGKRKSRDAESNGGSSGAPGKGQAGTSASAAGGTDKGGTGNKVLDGAKSHLKKLQSADFETLWGQKYKEATISALTTKAYEHSARSLAQADVAPQYAMFLKSVSEDLEKEVARVTNSVEIFMDFRKDYRSLESLTEDKVSKISLFPEAVISSMLLYAASLLTKNMGELDANNQELPNDCCFFVEQNKNPDDGQF